MNDSAPNNPTRTHSAATLTKEQLMRELRYRLALNIAENLKRQDVLSSADIRRIEQILRQKFSPPWGALTR